MRYINKYKKFNKVLLYAQTPFRLLKFKRPKWKKIQQIFKKPQSSSFINFNVVTTSYKSWEKLKNFYKDGLLLKSNITASLDDRISTKSFKKFIYSKQNKFLYNAFIFNTIIKPLYKLDLLLWKLNFFKSSYEAKQFINNKNLLVNNKEISSCLLLKAGDIIKFKNPNKIIFNTLNPIFLHFVEVDYYTKSLIVLKNFSNFNNDDYTLFLNDSLNIKKFIDYIRIK